MKTYLGIAILILSNLANASYVIDQKEKNQHVLDVLKLLGEEVQIPTNVTLDFNSGSGKLTR